MLAEKTLILRLLFFFFEVRIDGLCLCVCFDFFFKQFENTKVTEVGTMDPVKDFWSMWKQRDDVSIIERVSSLMLIVIQLYNICCVFDAGRKTRRHGGEGEAK